MATAVSVSDQLPPVAQLGFDHGWLILGPTFLNLGAPILIVDTVLTGDGHELGLDDFGTRNPAEPLPAAPLRIEISGRFVGIWDTRAADDDELVTIGSISSTDRLEVLRRAAHLILLLGDTRAAEQSWSALWRFTIGRAPLTSAASHHRTSIAPNHAAERQHTPAA